MLDAHLSQNQIAKNLKFHRSTISREICRNSGSRGYRPKQAEKKAQQRQDYRFQARRMIPPMIEAVVRKLKLKWSPEQISNRFKSAGLPSVSSESIYRYVKTDQESGGELWRNLRRSNRRRKRRFPSEDKRGRIKNAVSINKRHIGADNRSRVGHWERDSMLGCHRKGGLLVITDRKSRFNKLGLLQEKKSKKVTGLTKKLLNNLKTVSITNDRGLEFADHQKLTQKTGVPVYFCDPYSSYQRGSNENRIGIIRQYIPKGSDLRLLTQADIKNIEKEINHRPMKCLDWKTPYEVFFNKRCTTIW